jgi:hypothetical protein
MTTPVRRRAGKLLYRLTHRRPRWHGYDLVPHLAFERDADARWARALYRGREVARLTPYAELLAARPREIVVVGAGPSLAAQRLGRLRERAAILTNGALALVERAGLEPFAVVVEDESFVDACPQLVAGIPAGTAVVVTPPVLRAVCELEPALLGRWRVHLAEILHKPIGAPRPSPDELERAPFVRAAGDTQFSLDPQRGLGSCGTVAFVAAQLAVACRPAALGFAGVDLAGFDRPRFHELAGRRAPSHLERRLPSILRGFGLLAAICAELGIALRNHSPASRLGDAGIVYDDWLDAAGRAADPCASGPDSGTLP